MTESGTEFTSSCGREELRRGFVKRPLIPSFQLTNQIKYFPFSGAWVMGECVEKVRSYH